MIKNNQLNQFLWLICNVKTENLINFTKKSMCEFYFKIHFFNLSELAINQLDLLDFKQNINVLGGAGSRIIIVTNFVSK